MEIERKFIVFEESFDSIESRLSALGFRPDGHRRQIDEYFLPRGMDPAKHTHFMIKGEMAYLRLRRDAENETASLDLKTVNKERKGVFGEYECRLAGADSLGMAAKILDMLGFRKAHVIDKSRKSFKLGEVSVDMDEVRGLGRFVEVEIIDDMPGADRALARVDDLSAKLGLDPGNLMKTGYVDLMAAKLGGIGDWWTVENGGA
ncbi:MAG: class IV adenylate cyclase [Rickettsiales bacterium]|jgi:predicted adenylyl cyclase CyaB|nr:class IV adenylate cyclase [Rickettsiales bacterium]